MTTIHAGDHTTDCETCKANCSCGECEQTDRIKENIKWDLDYALETGDLDLFESIFEDRDPMEFL